MKNTLSQIFHSGKFLVGFFILLAILLTLFIYPLFVLDDPLGIIGQGTFFPPGTYVSNYDAVTSAEVYSLNLPGAKQARIADKLGDQERQDMKTWLVMAGIPEAEIDPANTEKLLKQWEDNYDPKKKIEGMIFAKQRYYQRLNDSVKGLLSAEGYTLAVPNVDTAVLDKVGVINQSDFVNINQVNNVKVLPLGTDNFGRDVLTELVKATGVSLQIGIVAGVIAT